jgi:hypothetical protein
MRVSVFGFPAGQCCVKELLQNRNFLASPTDTGTLTGELSAWDVRCLEFSR